MVHLIYCLIIIFECLNAVYLNEYEEEEDATEDNLKVSFVTNSTHKVNLKNQYNLVKNVAKVTNNSNNIDCKNFLEYSTNCTEITITIYDAYRKLPPLANRMGDWCRAVKHLSNCATAWNVACKESTDIKYSEESIAGNLHVINHICNDGQFLFRYDQSQECIENTTSMWEQCHSRFKQAVDMQRNTSYESTHYMIHFYLCCARAKFQQCTMDSLVGQCTQDESETLQKFSTIISEGEVFQECNNILYENCPGGDTSPLVSLHKLSPQRRSTSKSNHKLYGNFLTVFIMLSMFVFE